VTSQQPADRLLQLIKQAIDHSIANKSMFQECLTWVLQKSKSVQTNYKPAAIRAFYFDRALDRNWNSFQDYWQSNGTQWIEKLRQAIIEHQIIDRDWQFDDEQKQQLQRYYEVNKFLVDLMNISGAVSDTVRAQVEDTLVLPWEELQRRQPETYG
jgi:predicted NACHT family NTPase